LNIKNDKKNVLVVGSGGFVGTNLINQLANSNYRVRGLSRSFLQNNVGPPVELITLDLRDLAAVEVHCQWADVVVYLASDGAPATANDNVIASVEKGIVDSLRFFELCIKHGLSKLVYISSGGTVYGDALQVPTPETARLQPNNAYSIGKMAVEHYLSLYHQLHQLDYVVLRVSNPYGPYQFGAKNQGVIGRFIDLAFKGEPVSLWGDGSVIRDYIYIDDVCHAIVKAMEYQGPCRIMNIGSGVGRSLSEIIEVIRAKGLDLNVNKKPGLLATVGTSILDTSLAQKELGWAANTSIDSGIDQFIAWFKQRIAVKT
jgi:UDP-glucose 4-epimerase